MTYKSCPDWPELMEIAPDLQFKHYNAREAQLPADALMQIPELLLEEAEICADLERHVYFARHTDDRLIGPLKASHWYDLSEWTMSGPGRRT